MHAHLGQTADMHQVMLIVHAHILRAFMRRVEKHLAQALTAALCLCASSHAGKPIRGHGTCLLSKLTGFSGIVVISKYFGSRMESRVAKSFQLSLMVKLLL